MSGDTIGFTGDIVDAFGDNIRRYVRREPLANVVDVRRGY